MMRALALLTVLLLPICASAGEIEVGVHHVLAVSTGDSGDLDVPMGRGFEATAELFFSPRVSAHASALFVNPEAILYPSSAPGVDVDLGTIGIDLYSVSARYHLAAERRFSAFAGAGAALAVLGDLDDQFGPNVNAELEDEVTFFAEAGARYRFRPRLHLEFAAKYVPLETSPDVMRTSYPLPDPIGLDPLIVSLGATWRF
jgi:outer membrane protein W